MFDFDNLNLHDKILSVSSWLVSFDIIFFYIFMSSASFVNKICYKESNLEIKECIDLTLSSESP